MLYIIIIFVFLITTILLMNIRVRLDFGPDRRLLFVGLGRSGPEFDFVNHKGTLKICGLKVMGFRTDTTTPTKPHKPKTTLKPTPSKSRSYLSPTDLIKITGASSKAFFTYVKSIIRATSVEELEAKIEAGFESPELTGIAFGYYQAVLGAAPVLAGRVQFRPVWTGGCFRGELRASVAIPLYRIIFRTLALIWQLPSRKILKMAIGKKERSSG